MKIHLGCGERYLEGYRNIDFPPSAHTVQIKSVADEYADISELRYDPSSIDEIRLHHVFEHFTRPVACGLVATWHRWLKKRGVLHIEVPDFHRTALAFLLPFTSFHRKMVGIRHIFGSQEAGWAVHYDGYDCRRLKRMLTVFGFQVNRVKRNSWKGTYNIEIIACKDGDIFTKDKYCEAALWYLKQFCLDDSNTEQRMLNSWLNEFNIQLEKNY